MFLSAEQLAELTDRTQPAAQIRWLKRHRVPYWVSAAGRPKVRSEDLFGQQRTEPRWHRVR